MGRYRDFETTVHNKKLFYLETVQIIFDRLSY